jgi:hypothetical protein
VEGRVELSFRVFVNRTFYKDTLAVFFRSLLFIF